MPIVGMKMNHFTVLAKDLEATKDCRCLALSRGLSSKLGFPGAWLYAGDAAVLHIVAGRALPADPRGVLDHMAFSARDLTGTVRSLEARRIRYDLRRQHESGVWQLFCFHPNGARVELDFEAGERRRESTTARRESNGR